MKHNTSGKLTELRLGSRIATLDVMRGMAICVVILGHAIQRTVGISPPCALHECILIFQMPLFFVISGFASSLGRKEGFLVSVARMFRRLMVPYIAWVTVSLLLHLCQGSIDVTARGIFDHYCHNAFWFLRTLFIVSVIWKIALKTFNGTSTLNVLSLASALMCGLFVDGKIVLVYLTYFGFGNLAAAVWRKYFDSSLAKGLCSATAVAAAFALHLFFLHGKTFAGSVLLENVLISLLACYAVWGFSLIVSKRCDSLSRMLVHLGRESLALYAIHWWIFFTYIPAPPRCSSMPVWSHVTLVFAGWLVLSLCINRILKSTPLAPIFLGSVRELPTARQT